MTRKRIQHGQIPNIFNKKQGISKRQRAHAMFLDGKNVDEVAQTLDLKMDTTRSYLWEARYIAEHEPHRITAKRDPMLD